MHGYSTVDDLLAFANALVGHKLLDPEHTALLTTGKVDTPRGDKYALRILRRSHTRSVASGVSVTEAERLE